MHFFCKVYGNPAFLTQNSLTQKCSQEPQKDRLLNLDTDSEVRHINMLPAIMNFANKSLAKTVHPVVVSI